MAPPPPPEERIHELEVENRSLNKALEVERLRSEAYGTMIDQAERIALAEISEYTREQKEELAKLMGSMIVVDEDINYNEVRIYNVVNDFCKINVDFNMEDYPNYTRSGEFIAE